MSNLLPIIARSFADGEISVASLSAAVQAETVDRQTADKIWALLNGWDPSTGSMLELRERVRALL
jgi:hypothetical protein